MSFGLGSSGIPGFKRIIVSMGLIALISLEVCGSESRA